MKIAPTLWLLALLAGVSACAAPRSAVEVSSQRFQEHVAWLADDARGGRGTGTEGLDATARYVAEQFAAAGLAPGGDDGFLQGFEASGSRALGEGNALSVGAESFELKSDWTPFASTATSQAEASVVFAGYGIRDVDGGYDDYAGLDVSDKVVLVLRGGPGTSLRANSTDETAGARYLDAAGAGRGLIDFTTKINTAFKRGAAAIVVMNDPANYPPGSEKDVPLAYGASRSAGLSASLPAVHVSAAAAMRALGPLGLDMAAMQTRIDERMQPSSFDPGAHGGDLSDWMVSVNVVAERRLVSTYNVVGLLPGTQADEYVVVGAHMDHLGDGLSGGSLAGAEGRGKIHNGADDNASGTAGLMELAHVLGGLEQPLRRSVVFVAFGAEEWGLLGSHHFVDHPIRPLDQFVGMVNMDMIGRSEGGFLSVEGLGTSPSFPRLVELCHERLGAPFAKLAVSDGVPPNSDQAPFAAAGIPILSLFTGLHDDYHRPSDDTPLVDPKAGARIASLAGEFVMALATVSERPRFTDPTPPPAPVAVADPHDEGEPEEEREVKGYGVWFGSQPDMTYTLDDGVRVTGSSAGSPAERCGLVKGDVIISLDGKTVRNLQDYAVLLFSRRPGEVIKVGVRRDGKQIELEATLETKGGDS